MAKPSPDPSLVGYYLDDAWYEHACRASEDWRSMVEIPEALLPEEATRAACERLIHAEGRLIDDDRLEDWLTLYAPELLYWIPATREHSDPRSHITLEIHDRRRLEDRVARIRTGFAYSQLPPTRTAHLYTNMEMWTRQGDEVRVRANCHIDTFRAGEHRALSGWSGFLLRRLAGRWRIEIKQVNYLDAGHGQRNNSFFI